MCGIIGINSNKPVSATIINSLKKLEYRGYDSAGMATLYNGLINEVKSEGRVENLEKNSLVLMLQTHSNKVKIIENKNNLERFDCDAMLTNIDGVILQDYNKGVLNKLNIENIIGVCNSFNIPVYVDPKEKNFFQYKNTRLVTPNLSEFCAATNQEKLTKNFVLFENLIVHLEHE